MNKEIKPPFRLCSVKELQVKHIIKLLKNLASASAVIGGPNDVGIDGETMQYILYKVGMEEQMLKQLSNNLLEE
tara:strand:+ start:1722 stop:1943 length:222 start_codon:yes stop_codon:yes gene_type:complete